MMQEFYGPAIKMGVIQSRIGFLGDTNAWLLILICGQSCVPFASISLIFVSLFPEDNSLSCGPLLFTAVALIYEDSWATKLHP
jgi:hypothetical protein